MAKFRNWSRVSKFCQNLTFLTTADLKKLEMWQNLEIGVAFKILVQFNIFAHCGP